MTEPQALEERHKTDSEQVDAPPAKVARRVIRDEVLKRLARFDRLSCIDSIEKSAIRSRVRRALVRCEGLSDKRVDRFLKIASMFVLAYLVVIASVISKLHIYHELAVVLDSNRLSPVLAYVKQHLTVLDVAAHLGAVVVMVVAFHPAWSTLKHIKSATVLRLRTTVYLWPSIVGAANFGFIKWASGQRYLQPQYDWFILCFALLVAGILFCTLMGTLIVANVLITRKIEKRVMPEDSVISVTLVLLERLENVSPKGFVRLMGPPSFFSPKLEWIAECVQKRSLVLGSADSTTSSWLRAASKEIADSIRELKRLVSLPSADSQQVLTTKLASLLVSVASCQWQDLPRVSVAVPAPATVWKARGLSIVKVLMWVAVPYLLLRILHLLNVPTGDSATSTIVMYSVAAAVIALTDRNGDATAADQVAIVKNVLSLGRGRSAD